MNYIISATGLQIMKATSDEHPAPGEYVHLASRDAQAPSGEVKVLAHRQEDIRELYETLRGQALQVGLDFVAVEVKNDLITIQGMTGNGVRVRL